MRALRQCTVGVVVTLLVASASCKSKPAGSLAQDAGPPRHATATPTPTPKKEESFEELSKKLAAIDLPAWPGWPLPKGLKMSAPLYCEGVFATRVFIKDPRCTPEDAVRAQVDAGFDRLFTKKCIERLGHSLESARARLEPKATAKCIEGFVDEVTSQRDRTPAYVKACEDAVVGAVTKGGACRFPWECAAKLTCVGFGENVDGNCVDMPGVKAACGEKKGAGSTVDVHLEGHPLCEKGARCSFGTCEKALVAGEPCTGNSLCTEDLKCRAGTCSKQEPLADGEVCIWSSDCTASATCDKSKDSGEKKIVVPGGSTVTMTTGHCKSRKATGQPCASDDECRGRCSSQAACVSVCGSG